MTSLYYLRDKELPAHLAAKLAPFIRSWAPHSKPPKTTELKAQGYERIEKESFVDLLEDNYFERRGYYPEENPALLLASESLL
jgi:hypothetical protein